ncbi:hypothetical protein [Turneriella parva]|uniref:Uncharacterized protein n=1 Tax=Turneriella parva (strain ATCC BAA-1111 / DSM 21527 / NCTC 11395 / H) TaxID=869212 RepID=I4B9K4_TURPD|nr:hypothetical protein [Turneriella parva]AFM13961.1 hypothetical protein Turpa_3323 [Turneriella parva DSM 21527]
MKVESSGVVMIGTCEIKGENCTAKGTPGAITAVWRAPGRNQVNVCHNCLNEQISKGIWEIAGARIMSKT